MGMACAHRLGAAGLGRYAVARRVLASGADFVAAEAPDPGTLAARDALTHFFTSPWLP